MNHLKTIYDTNKGPTRTRTTRRESIRAADIKTS